jgi:hypothetical protein
MSNRDVGIRFRNEVLLYLIGQGITHASDPFEGKRLSELVGDVSANTDIAGLGWAVDVRTGRGVELSTGLEDARRGAAASGTDFYVTIQGRRGHPLSDSYCVIPLHVLARLFKGELPVRSTKTTGLPG